MFANLLYSPNYKTLPPNLYQYVEVVGEVMPGFNGVNSISTDSRGFRTSKKVNYEDPSSFRIFAIGGSTTEEIYIDNQETWTARLEGLVKKESREFVETINTGLSGLRAPNHLSTMQKTETLNPDLYLFLVGGNDWNYHIKSYLHNGIQSYLHKGIRKNMTTTPFYVSLNIVKNFLISKVEFTSNDVRREKGDYYSNQNNSLSKADIRTLNFNKVNDEYEDVMNKIAYRCNSNSYQCMFISQPSAYSQTITDELRIRLWMTPPNEAYTLDLQSLIQISSFYNEWLKNFTKTNELYFCDLASEIEPSTEFFFDDIHFNENGSKKVAEVIAKCINRYLLKND